MKFVKRTAVLLCTLLAAGPALAGYIFIPWYASALTATAIGTGSSSTNDTTVSMTTSAAVAAGESIVVLAAQGGTQTFSSYSDSATNTYTETVESGLNGGSVAIAFSSGVSALASSSTITATLNANNARKAIAAITLNRAISAIASAAASATGDSATPSVTTGASIPDGAVVVGAIAVTTGGDTVTLPAGWTSLFNAVVNGNDIYAFAYKITTAAGSVTFNPTKTGTEGWSVAVAAYN